METTAFVSTFAARVISTLMQDLDTVECCDDVNSAYCAIHVINGERVIVVPKFARHDVEFWHNFAIEAHMFAFGFAPNKVVHDRDIEVWEAR